MENGYMEEHFLVLSQTCSSHFFWKGSTDVITDRKKHLALYAKSWGVERACSYMNL